ncbi:MAG TPA: aldose 1-epimerase [Parafilimonas sp.]|nr:aldose 1-epimerase [Parafilimonas sp.]
MAFTIDINEKEIFPVIHLTNDAEEASAEIYAFGALLNNFKTKNSINIIDGFASPQDAMDNITNGFKSAKLSPFVCRIANGKYVYNNHQYTVNKFYLAGEAIHGLLFDAIFSVTDSGANNDSAFVTLDYKYTKKDEGYPFDYTCTITYRLEKDKRLSIETSLKNNSDAAIPVCDGWHPYFTLGVKVDDLLFEMNTTRMVEFNDKLVPTGNIVAYSKFQQPEIFGNTFLDNCFLVNENNKPACILTNTKTGLQVIINPDKSYPYLQVYTPEHRNSIAIENLSAVPDAFNNKTGLTILNADESIAFKTSLSIKS